MQRGALLYIVSRQHISIDAIDSHVLQKNQSSKFAQTRPRQKPNLNKVVS